ncbi:MAG: DUF2909 domain-containing protein [Ottowia sp.]|nr:DUF2909 domain-containing protein [Ottowia sp.]
MKTLLIGAAFVAIVACLASAGFFMMRDEDETDPQSNRKRATRMFMSLALRVGLSVSLFVVILLAWEFGLIQPTGIPG